MRLTTGLESVSLRVLFCIYILANIALFDRTVVGQERREREKGEESNPD